MIETLRKQQKAPFHLRLSQLSYLLMSVLIKQGCIIEHIICPEHCTEHWDKKNNQTLMFCPYVQKHELTSQGVK